MMVTIPDSREAGLIEEYRESETARPCQRSSCSSKMILQGKTTSEVDSCLGRNKNDKAGGGGCENPISYIETQ